MTTPHTPEWEPVSLRTELMIFGLVCLFEGLHLLFGWWFWERILG